MARCDVDGCAIRCPGGCYCLVVLDPEPGDDSEYCGCVGGFIMSPEDSSHPEESSQPKIEVRRSSEKSVEMSLADFSANYTPKNKLRPETKVSFTCEDVDSSILAEVLQKISLNEITVPERIADKKLKLTLKNTTLAEVMRSSGFA